MKTNSTVEKCYRKYFKEKVEYSEDWKYKMLDRLGKQQLHYFNPFFKYAVSSLLILIIFSFSFLLYKNYTLEKRISRYENLLFSQSAINHVIYQNMGAIISSYYLQKAGMNSLNDDDIRNKIRKSLISYLLIANPDAINEETINIINEALDRITPEYIEYFSNNSDELLI